MVATLDVTVDRTAKLAVVRAPDPLAVIVARGTVAVSGDPQQVAELARR